MSVESLLQKVYNELKYLNIVKNQTDFGDKLGFNKSWTSTILKRTGSLDENIKNKLCTVYGISRAWLDSDGKIGTDIFGKQNNYNNKNTENQPITGADSLDSLHTNYVPEMLRDLIALHRASTEVALTLARANEALSRSKEQDSDSMHIMAKSIERLLAGGAAPAANFQQAS